MSNDYKAPPGVQTQNNIGAAVQLLNGHRITMSQETAFAVVGGLTLLGLAWVFMRR